MKRSLVKPAQSLILAGCLALSSCAQPDRFASFVDEYFDGLHKFNPTLAVENGFHEFDSLIEDLTPAAHNRRMRQLRIQIEELSQLRRDGLSPEQSIDAGMIQAALEAEMLEIAEMKTWQTNPMTYVGVPGSAMDAVMKRNFAPAKDRVVSATQRLKGVPALMNSLRDNVLNPAPEHTDLAIDIAKGAAGFLRNEVATWAKESTAGDAKVLTDFTKANDAAAASIDKAADWMTNELKPRSKGSFAIGADAYAKKLRFEEMVDIPLPELLAIGERNLERDYQALLATARQLAPKAKPEDTVRHISDDYPKPAELLPSTKATLTGIRQFLIDRRIVRVPSQILPIVEETPPYARSGSFASMSSPGPYETKATEAYYFVTPVEPGWSEEQKIGHLRQFSPAVLKIITIHEAFPGHYLQFLYSKNFPTKTRRLLAVSSNAEGWAHYAEQMMIEQGFGDGDLKLKIAQLQEALLRDCRYIAGIKLHTQSWTVEQATQLFVDKTLYDRAIAYPEARRGTFDPTYLYYTLGKLMIYKLRDDYRAARGSAYSLESFHNEFVSLGSIPLPLVRKIMLGSTGKLL